MATVQLTLDDRKGITQVVSTVSTISEALDNAALMARVAPAVRLLHNSAKEASGQPTAQLPSETADIFMCGCGATFISAGEACTHVEREHANKAIRRDLDRLEDLIEFMVVPSPLTQFPESVIPTRSYAKELHQELKDMFKRFYQDKHNHGRASKVMAAAGWNDVKGMDYTDYKREIVLREDRNGNDRVKKIQPAMHEDFLRAYAMLLSQVGAVLTQEQ
jgi:hypothetical protein